MQKGLTLVEIIISSGIAVVVGTLLLGMMVNSTGLFYKESAKVNVGLSANDALSAVRSSIKESWSVAATYVDGSSTYTSGPTTLILQIPALDSSGNIITGVFDFFVFFKDANMFRLKIFPNLASSRKAQDQILTNKADNLLFQYFNLDTPPVEVLPLLAAKVKITLTLKEKTGPSSEIKIATSEAILRND